MKNVFLYLQCRKRRHIIRSRFSHDLWISLKHRAYPTIWEISPLKYKIEMNITVSFFILDIIYFQRDIIIGRCHMWERQSGQVWIFRRSAKEADRRPQSAWRRVNDSCTSSTQEQGLVRLDDWGECARRRQDEEIQTGAGRPLLWSQAVMPGKR